MTKLVAIRVARFRGFTPGVFACFLAYSVSNRDLGRLRPLPLTGSGRSDTISPWPGNSLPGPLWGALAARPKPDAFAAHPRSRSLDACGISRSRRRHRDRFADRKSDPRQFW